VTGTLPRVRGVRLAVLTLVLLGAADTAYAAERTVVRRSPGFLVGPFQTLKPKVFVPSPGIDGHITRMHVRLVDARGRPVTIRNVMLHHTVFVKRGRFRNYREAKCGADRKGQPIYGTGEENQSLALPRGYGYRIRRSDRWRLQTMLMSHQNRAQRVFVEWTMRIATGEHLTPVTPHWVAVTHCAKSPSYQVGGGLGPGARHVRSNTWRVPRDGRIVAAGSHLHGGALDFAMTQPRCGERRVVESPPYYGMPDDLVYRARPVLHEPGPVGTGWYTSRQGFPIRRGERMRVTALYDAELPHPGVMAVMHVYVAPARRGDRAARRGCLPPPSDAKVGRFVRGPVRTTPPPFEVPLNGLDAKGRTVVLERLTGPVRVYDAPGAKPVAVALGTTFRPARLSVANGTQVTWAFDDGADHKVQLANGPKALGSPTLNGGVRWSHTFWTPGEYQLFCYLHPVTMHQEVTVRP